MNQYIDRKILLKKIQNQADGITRGHGYVDYIQGFRDAIKIIENTPTVDVQEVKHAHWIHYGEYCECSNCGHVTEDYCIDGDNESGYYTVLPHYCSNCT